MQQENWAHIADIYAELIELPENTQFEKLDLMDLPSDDKETLKRLLSTRTRRTDYLATGGAIGKELNFLQTGDQIGNWRVIDIIGAGGMGEVYRVERADGHFTQTAALKRIAISDLRAFERFERERQILAQLEHPNIGRLIDGGVDEQGAPFLVMEYIEGLTLNDFVASRRLTTEQTLRLFLKVCSALAHAHGRFVLHRDIKPSNMMVTSSGDVKLIDFGVAGLIEEADEDLRAPMTLQYAAPEQLEGRTVSIQTDLFSLGLTLGELLTQTPVSKSLSSVRADYSRLSADLRAILHRATATDTASRYESVDAFASDIRNFLVHRPVEARNGNAVYRTGRFLRRNLMAVGLFGVLLAGLCGTSWQYLKAEAERDIAMHERERLRTMQAATFLMFSEAGNSGSDTTARTLILKAADQAKADFERHPDDAAAVLQMFGEMLFLMNDYTSAEPMLQAVSELKVKPGNEDIIARASHDLANVYIRSGKVDDAQAALDRSLDIWNMNPIQYRDQILSSVLIQSQLAAAKGNLEEAETLLSESLPLRIAWSGEQSLETAILLTNIGVARMRLGDIPGAIEASDQAREIFQMLGRLDTPDGLNTMNNLATFFHVSGRLEEAEAAYQSTLEIRQQLYGPSAALAVLMSNFGKLKLQQGKAEEASTLLSDAVVMADEFSGASSPPALAARFGLIEALTELENPQRAELVLDDVRSGLEAAGITNGPYVGLFHIATAQIEAAKGNQASALDHLDLADAIFKEIGPAADRFAAKSNQLREILVSGTPGLEP